MILGKVEDIEKNFAVVRIERQEMCGECHACDLTGGKKKCTIKCQLECSCEVGQTVEVELEETTFIAASALMYGIPLIGLGTGLLIGGYVLQDMTKTLQEVGMVVMGFTGMGISFWGIRNNEKKKKYEKFLPRVVKIVNN